MSQTTAKFKKLRKSDRDLLMYAFENGSPQYVVCGPDDATFIGVHINGNAEQAFPFLNIEERDGLWCYGTIRKDYDKDTNN